MKNITQAQLKEAVALWESFNRALAIRGMRLNYDNVQGTLYVCDKHFHNGWIGDNNTYITAEEYESVLTNGALGNVVNNPPWFTDGTEYTLASEGTNHD